MAVPRASPCCPMARSSWLARREVLAKASSAWRACSPVANSMYGLGRVLCKSVSRWNMATSRFPEDQALVQACLQGDQPAWNLLVGRYQPRLIAYFRRHVGADQADEMAAELWYSLLKHDGARLRDYD